MQEERAEHATTTFLVEHYWPGVTADDFAAAAESVRAAAHRLAAEGTPIRYLHSTLVPEDEAAFCVVEAASRSTVEKAYEQAGIRFERIVDAVESTADAPGLEARRA